MDYNQSCNKENITHFIGCSWMKRKLRPRCTSPEITASKRYKQNTPKPTVPNNPEMPLQPKKHQKHPKFTIYVDMTSTCSIRTGGCRSQQKSQCQVVKDKKKKI
jgi:hypothetical protein